METEKKSFEKPVVTEEQEILLTGIALEIRCTYVICVPDAMRPFMPHFASESEADAIIQKFESEYGEGSLTILKVEKEEE